MGCRSLKRHIAINATSCSRPATARVSAVSAVYLFQLGSGPRDSSCNSRRSRVAQPVLSSLAVYRLQLSSSDPQQLSVHDSGCWAQRAGPRCPLVCIRRVELRAAARRITVMARTDPKGRAPLRCEWRRKIPGTRKDSAEPKLRWRSELIRRGAPPARSVALMVSM